MLHALQNRDFRLLWTGLALSAVGTWMQIVAGSLLVLDLTHGSAFKLGTVSVAQAVAFLLFAPVGGTAADRISKRRLLLLTQSIMMGFALLLGVLTASGEIRFWMFPLIAFANGAVLSFDQPARNALIGEVVPKESLMNAIALQSAVFNGASLGGPALAGLVLSRIGYAGNFFLNAASFLGILVALMLVQDPEAHGITRPAGRLLDSVREVLTYVRRDEVLPSVIGAYGALLFFGPSTALMLPLFARQILHAGPSQLGVLFSAAGAGAVVSAFVVASLGDFRQKRRLLFWSILIWVAALVTFGISSSMSVAVPALFVLGAAQNAAGAASVTLLQTRVLPNMRGRAMSVNTLLIMFVRPLGDFPAGALVGVLGLRQTVLAGAVVVAIVCGLLARRRAERED
jgi:MFS family permease